MTTNDMETLLSLAALTLWDRQPFEVLLQRTPQWVTDVVFDAKDKAQALSRP